MSHGKKGHGAGHAGGALSLVSILMNAIADLLVNRKVHKVADKVKGDPEVKKAIDNANDAYAELEASMQDYCERYPEYCEKIANMPFMKDASKK